MHVIAAKAVCFAEALRPEFIEYQKQIIKNAGILASELMGYGFDLVSGGTDNHLILIDLTSKGITGIEAETALGKAGIYANKNTIPFDKRNPQITSGLRIGTPALTTRGMKETEMKEIAGLISAVISRPADESVIRDTRSSVKHLVDRFPIYDFIDIDPG